MTPQNIKRDRPTKNLRTLCFLIEESKVWLAMKKRGFGVDKWNGVGGKLEPGEGVREAAIREIYEEIGVKVTNKNLKRSATIDFRFPDEPDNKNMNVRVCVYTTKKWEGVPHETEEMAPKTFLFGEIPYDNMWEDDRYWLPLVLQGKKVYAVFNFSRDNNTSKEKLTDYKVKIFAEEP
ncbi:MAG: 8-oxo-dGTP diphosphatase [Candidatus Daviesbacteria bacterium]|nr:8-oxo-dGTP diphosphatase [Candidatus Daviesbacteria bacterium]